MDRRGRRLPLYGDKTMTKQEVKTKIQNLNWKQDDRDIYNDIKAIVTEYQNTGEDNKLDDVLNDYMDEPEAIDFIRDVAFDEGVEAVRNCINYICRFTGVYKKNAWEYLEDADLDDLCDEILRLLGLDRYEEEDDD